MLLLFNKHNSDHIQIQTLNKIYRFVIRIEACLTQWTVDCTKVSGKSDFSDDIFGCDEDHDRKKWKMLIAIRHFK